MLRNNVRIRDGGKGHEKAIFYHWGALTRTWNWLTRRARFGPALPSRLIQLVIPGAPGDAQDDVVARLVAEELAKILKVPVVPRNKPGGAQMIGTDFVAKSKKDG